MARNIKALLVLIAFLEFSIFNFQFSKAYANAPCKPIYGGGKTCTSSANITPDKKSTPPAPTTKRGFPVLSPVPVTSTPSTGPEALVLFSLIPAGILGWLLRKYSTKRNFKQPPSL